MVFRKCPACPQNERDRRDSDLAQADALAKKAVILENRLQSTSEAGERQRPPNLQQ
jgi:hypothetical protein